MKIYIQLKVAGRRVLERKREKKKDRRERRKTRRLKADSGRGRGRQEREGTREGNGVNMVKLYKRMRML